MENSKEWKCRCGCINRKGMACARCGFPDDGYFSGITEQQNISINRPVSSSADSEDDFDDEIEFISCSKCDDHPACEDFGCAYELGLGRMVKKDIPHGSDDWG